jgi:hypothetical protein
MLLFLGAKDKLRAADEVTRKLEKLQSRRSAGAAKPMLRWSGSK